MLRFILFTFLLNTAFLATGQAVYDTVILFDQWQAKQFLRKYKLSEDALRITINQDSFLLDARITGKPMKLNKRKEYLAQQEIRQSISFHYIYYISRFSGIRIILNKDQQTKVRIQSIKTRHLNKWNNLDIDTVLAMSKLSSTNLMLWNLYYFGAKNECGGGDMPRQPCRIVDNYQMHSVYLPQMTEIRRSRRAKQKIAAIEKTLQWEVNLVTGIITNYKTGEKRKVRNTN